MNVWIARQPIFDRGLKLYAYELLFRAKGNSDCFDGTESAMATTQVLAHTFLGIGLDNVLAGHKAFVNFDRSLLIGSLHSILPPEKVVLEVLESVDADPEVTAACRDLRAKGYTIALDDFISHPGTEPLTHFAQIIKVDIQTTSRAEQARMLAAYHPRGIAMLAEKVETREEFAWARAAGYDYFQGHFFARPAMMPGRQLSPLKAACLGLLNETRRLDLDFNRIGALIRSDVALSWQLLRYVNSALYHPVEGINSIHQALTIVGEEYIRNWATLATLSTLAKDKPDELVTLSLVRAHFSEYLARLMNIRQSSDAFLMGLLSLIDALIDLPLSEALSLANVAACIRDALLETSPTNEPLRMIRGLTSAWELGDWAAVSGIAAQAGIAASAIGEAYAESTLWAEKARHGIGRDLHSRRSIRQIGDRQSLQLKWADAAQEEMIRVRIVNISAGGLGLESIEGIPLNSCVSFDSPEKGISGRGSVRYCHSFSGKSFIGIACRDEVGSWNRDWKTFCLSTPIDNSENLDNRLNRAVISPS
jgi:c-di-GMP-related signal transduction protein